MPPFEITSARKRVTIRTTRSAPVARTLRSFFSSVRCASDHTTSTSSCSREPTQRYSVTLFTPSSSASALMSIRSAARNFRRASRNASSGVGRRRSAAPVRSRCSFGRPALVVLMLRSFADSCGCCGRATFRVFVAYPHRTSIPTRWKDNDVYGHVNNVEYYSFFDTAINAWLIQEGGLDIHAGEVIGVCAESHCRYKGGIAFPDTIDVGLRVGKLGRSSVRYELELGRAGEPGALAEGWFVHVFVDRGTRRPVEIPAPLRGCLERLQVAA